MRRIVLDTNVLVSGAYDDLSAGARILEACTRGELTAVVSPPLRREYERIIADSVKIRGHEEAVRAFLARAEEVVPQETPSVVPDDPEDDKVVAAAVAGKADAIITSDRHLLELDPYQGIRILRPKAFVEALEEKRGGTWRDLTSLIGIGPRT